MPHVNGVFCVVFDFIECDHDIPLDVPTTFRQFFLCVTAGKTASRKPGTPASRAEQLLEEIAETRAAEFEFLGATVAAARVAPAETAPTGRRLKIRALLPILTQLVVFHAFGGIAEDFVGLIDFLEFLFRLLFVLGDVGMIFPR